MSFARAVLAYLSIPLLVCSLSPSTATTNTLARLSEREAVKIFSRLADKELLLDVPGAGTFANHIHHSFKPKQTHL